MKTDTKTPLPRGSGVENSGPASGGQADAIVVDPEVMGTAANIASGVFSSEYEIKGIPADWKERARKAWEYYIEEPIVSNTINTWRTFAIGDQVKITADDEEARAEAQALFYALNVNRFLKDMILQLLVKGSASDTSATARTASRPRANTTTSSS